MFRQVQVIALVAACGGGGKSEAPAPRGLPLAQKSYFRVDARPRACPTCDVVLELRALDGYHVNAEYPNKFEAETPVSSATFKVEREDLATLTIATKEKTIAGVFKLSVCSDDQCQIEAPKIVIE